MMSWKKWIVSGFLAVLSMPGSGNSALASFTIHSQVTVPLEVKGYSGLDETTLFKGSLKAGEQQKIDTSYQGLALLVFDKGQQYPVILGGQSFITKIADPGHPPSFTASAENDFFYKLLTGQAAGTDRFNFPLLMLEAKKLLRESSSIKTVADLTAMKERFHAFAGSHYRNLRHSDMLRRLIARYFMMHEYVDYHVQGAPVKDIQVRYRKAVVNGVENWIRILRPYIPAHEVVNYCVSLYYNRSMVTLAHLIVSRFKEIAFCPGSSSLKTVQFPENEALIDAAGNNRGTVKDFSNGVVAFVSEDCPVSMVETVIKARALAKQGKGAKLVVAPLQKIFTGHLAMRAMVSKDNMLFVRDEQWTRQLPKDIRLPLFVDIAASRLKSNPDCPE